jgi:hypothetical protein
MELEPEKLKAATVVALAQSHIRHFRYMIDNADSPGLRGTVRIAESHEYLEIWERVLRAANTVAALDPASSPWTALDEAGQTEVSDAVDCGDYDELIASVEAAT